MDLTYEIFKEMSQWGTAPDESFIVNIRSELSSHSEAEVSAAIDAAIKLQELVLGSGKFYKDGFGEIQDGIKGYIQAGLPNVSPECLRLASRRIMFMYIK